MNAFKERLLENDLAEMLGGRRPPDLTQQTLARLAGTSLPREGARREPAGTAQGRVYKPRLARRHWMRLLEAACIAAAFGVMAWLLWPGDRNEQLPAGVKASPGAQFTVSSAAIKLDKGWLLLGENSPTVMVGDSRIDRVHGKLIVKTGTVPNANELSELQLQLQPDLNDKENAMLIDPKRWLVAGTMAVCLFNGSVAVNGETIVQDAPLIEIKDEFPTEDVRPAPPAKTEGFKVLRSRVGKDSDIEKPEYTLVQNNQELNDLLSRHATEGWDKPPIAADFDKEMIIGIFRGRCQFDAMEPAFHGASMAADRYVLKFQLHFFGQRMGKVPFRTPYGFFVVPKTECRIDIEYMYIHHRTGLKADGYDTNWVLGHSFNERHTIAPEGFDSGVVASHFAKKSGFLNNGFEAEAPFLKLISSAALWDKIWEAHAPGTAKPFAVDFEKQSVVMVLLGPLYSHDGLSLDQTIVDAKTRLLRLNDGNNNKVNHPGDLLDHPCAFFLVKNDSRTHQIEIGWHHAQAKPGYRELGKVEAK